MCPDPQLLSIYLDGELPSPWKEKMQEHFKQCSKCMEKLENYRRLQELFKKDSTVRRTIVERIIDEPAKPRTYTEQELIEANNLIITESKERVWKKIQDTIKANSNYMPENIRAFNPDHFRSHSTLWQRKLSVPIPAIAAAAVVILVLTVLWFLGTGNNKQTDPADNASFLLAAEMNYIDDIPGIIPAADMSGVLQYLAPNSGTNIIILQLPESKNFSRAGDPAIIRAADFTRHQQEPQQGRRGLRPLDNDSHIDTRREQ